MAASLPRQLQPLKVNPRTNEVYLQLPPPHDNIIITPPRTDDAPAHVKVLNDPLVYPMLASPPFPYLLEHAEEWIASTKQKCDAVLDLLQTAAENEKSNDGDSQPSLIFVDTCPVRVLREVQSDGSDVFIGDIGITRNGRFDHLRDKEKEDALLSHNNALPVGSPEIIWMFGYLLASTHHGKGIMTAAVRTIMHEWAIPRMNAHIIQGTAFTGNIASVKVFLKNGFEETDRVEECVTIAESKGGGVVGLHCLEWRRPV